MKSFFHSGISRFNVLAVLFVVSATILSSPLTGSAQNACVRTSTGKNVCGELILDSSSKDKEKPWILRSPSFWIWNNQCSANQDMEFKITLVQTGNKLYGTVRTLGTDKGWEDTPVSGSISGRDVQISFTRLFTVTFSGKVDQDGSRIYGIAKGCGGAQANFSMAREN